MDATIIPFPTRTRPACWSDPLHELLDEAESILDDGDAAGVVELCRTTLAQLHRASADIDDDEPLARLIARLDDLHRLARARHPSAV